MNTLLSRARSTLMVLAAGALAAAAWCVPPDGHERSELAQFLGRFHPLVVHLPIAFLLLVPILEVVGTFGRSPPLKDSAGFVLRLATASALAAAGLGWLLGWSGGYDGPLVTHHLWGGVVLCLVCLVCCFLRSRMGPGRPYGLSLFVAIGVMLWTSHQGGSITHGETFLTQYMPTSLRRLLHLPQVPIGKDTFFSARVVPILENNCVTCHSPSKHKGDLRMDSYSLLMKGGEHGAVIKPGDPKASELLTRITLPADDKKFMPSDGKRPLSNDEIKVIELWIAAGASATLAQDGIKGAPAIKVSAPYVALAPDYRPRLAQIRSLEASLGVHLVPRSQIATDGLILRTVSAPERCNDSVLVMLKPVADLIVDAELARTRITDSGLRSVATWSNLHKLDLSHTAVGPDGLVALTALKKLGTLNLTDTSADESVVAKLRVLPALKQIYTADLRAAPGDAPVRSQ
jgi:uncharacterized membrane protein